MKAGSILAAAILGCGGAASAEVSWVHGFVQSEGAHRVLPGECQGPACANDFVRGGGRLQLEASPQGERWGLLAKGELIYDAAGADLRACLREGYLDLRFPFLDLRLGRQIVTWGVGDLIFITDVFPKDRVALITGLPVDYLKKGSDAVNATAHLAGTSFQLVLIPRFEGDTVPENGGRLTFNDPFPAISARHKDEPPFAIDNLETGLRVAANLAGWDLALSGYRGFFHTPSGQVQPGPQLRLYYPRLDVYGATAQGTAAGGVLSAEAGHYHSRDDRSGTNPAIENSSFRGLLGYQREIVPDLTASVQYYVQVMQDHDRYLSALPPSVPAQPTARHVVTARLTRLYLNQTLKLGVYVQGSPNQHDLYATPEARYSFTDALSAALGVNLFLGPRATEFGQFEGNSNLYLIVRYAL
jgi:hypothetical protein